MPSPLYEVTLDDFIVRPSNDHAWSKVRISDIHDKRVAIVVYSDIIDFISAIFFPRVAEPSSGPPLSLFICFGGSEP